MRRGLTAAVGTVLGTALLIVAKYSPTPSDSLAADLPAETVPGPSAHPATSGVPPSSARPSGVPIPRTSPTGKPRTTAKPGPTAKGTGLKNGTFAGPGVSERFGVITVTITVSSGRISNVDATCSCSGRSQSISTSAFAKLEPRVLTAQSANVQAVSGATYTFSAYRQSLGAAIDTAKG
jgi:uncharacterized protein with FMN-binding domain